MQELVRFAFLTLQLSFRVPLRHPARARRLDAALAAMGHLVVCLGAESGARSGGASGVAALLVPQIRGILSRRAVPRAPRYRRHLMGRGKTQKAWTTD